MSSSSSLRVWGWVCVASRRQVSDMLMCQLAICGNWWAPVDKYSSQQEQIELTWAEAYENTFCRKYRPKPLECLRDAVYCVWRSLLDSPRFRWKIVNNSSLTSNTFHFANCCVLQKSQLNLEFVRILRSFDEIDWWRVCNLCVCCVEFLAWKSRKKWNKRRMDGNEPHVNTFVLSSLKSSPTQIAWPVRLYSVSTCLLPSNAYTRNSHTTTIRTRRV